jgi:hypothetical protein
MVSTSVSTVSSSQKTFKPTDVIESPYLTTEQAAQYLQIAPITLRVWRMNPVHPLRFVLIGTRVRYRIEDLENFVNNPANHRRKQVSPNVGRPPGKKSARRKKAAR